MESLPHVSLDILLLTQWFLQFWGLLFGSEIATEITPVGGLRFTGFYRSISQYFTIYHLIWENAFFFLLKHRPGSGLEQDLTLIIGGRWV